MFMAYITRRRNAGNRHTGRGNGCDQAPIDRVAGVRMLFTSTPVHSHVRPMLPLAVTARELGHEVVFATTTDIVPAIEDAGLTAVHGGSSFAESARRYRETFPPDTLSELSPAQRLGHLMLHCLIGLAAPAMAEHLVPFARKWRPDLVISNLAEWAGGIAAADLGVPHVMHGFSPPKPAEIGPAIDDAMADLRTRWGLPAAHDNSREPYLDIWPESLRPRVQNWLYPTAWPLRPDTNLPLADPGPFPAVLDGMPYDFTVYVTLGTTHNGTPGVLATMIDGLREEQVNVVVTVGPDGDPGQFGDLPDYIRVERYVPQETLLPYCDAVVCHAGAGSVLGALAHGIPLVMVPIAADQHEIAQGVAEAGAGVTPAATTADVRDAFRSVREDPAYAKAAARIRDDILAMPTPETVVARLETCG